MSDDDLNVMDRFSKSGDLSEKLASTSPKYGSPTSIRSRSSVRIMEKRKMSISTGRKRSTGSILEERARSPSLQRITRKTSLRPKTPSSPRPQSPAPVVIPANTSNISTGSRDELIKLHRQAIKDNNDFSKQESKILVNLTMKMGKQLLENPNGANLVDEAFEKYLNELESILSKKMESMTQMQNIITKFK